MADKPADDDDMPMPVPEAVPDAPAAEGAAAVAEPVVAAEGVKADEPSPLPAEASVEPPPPSAEKDAKIQEEASKLGKEGKKSLNTAEGVDGDGKKAKRKTSMFTEATEAKDLMAFTAGGDIQSTLQAFFKERSTSVENVPVKRLRRPKLIFENTYRLEAKKPFVSSRVQPIITKTLEDMLEGVMYNSKTIHTLGTHIAEKIRNRVLALEYDRVKIVVHVAIGTMSRQGVFMACKTVSDPNRDSYAVGHFKNHFLFSTATVHAIYYE